MEVIPSGVIKKTFGHCFVLWKIHNFSLAICHESFIVCSSEFTIKEPEVTDWEMDLETTSDEDGSILFHLKRLQCGPRVVWVNWTVNLMNGEGKHITKYECEGFFERKQKHVIDLESVKYILEMQPSNDVDSIAIACHIFVKYEDNDADIEPKELTDAGLKSMSQDFRRMLRRGKYYDVVLRIDNKDIRAHKSILVRRNDNLGKLISEAEYSKIVFLPDVDAEATEAIISYLYTGNLRYVLRSPSVALYNCIELFDVEEIKPYFLPDKVEITSKIKSQEATFRWLIPNFRQKHRIIHTDDLTRNGLNSTWRMHIYPHGIDQCSGFVAIQTEVVNATGFQGVCIELALLDVFNEAVNNVRVLGHLVAGEWISIDNFCNRRCLDEVLKRGELRIVLTIRLSTGDQDSSIVSDHNMGNTEIRTLPHYRSLSTAMKSIFIGVLYKDVILKAKSAEVFQAHKCVLAARSKTFARMLGKFEDNVAIDIEGNILKILLEYIYCGTLDDQQMSDLFQLYKTAEEYSISALKLDCCRLLLSKIDVQNMREIFLFAKDNQEQELKAVSLRFIQTYKNDVPTDSNRT